MTLLHAPTHPGIIQSPDLPPEPVPAIAQPLGTVAVVETIERNRAATLPWIPHNMFEPYGSERDRYTEHLQDDRLYVDPTRPWMYREEVKNSIGLDMNLLAIAQRGSRRASMATETEDSVERDFRERKSRVYMFAMPRKPDQPPSVMVANGLYLAEVDEARAAGKEIPETSNNMRIVEYGNAVKVGDDADKFKVQLTKDGGVIITDRSEHGTDVISVNGATRPKVLILGGVERPKPIPRTHQLDRELTLEESMNATPTDPWGHTMKLPVIRPQVPSHHQS